MPCSTRSGRIESVRKGRPAIRGSAAGLDGKLRLFDPRSRGRDVLDLRRVVRPPGPLSRPALDRRLHLGRQRHQVRHRRRVRAAPGVRQPGRDVPDPGSPRRSGRGARPRGGSADRPGSCSVPATGSDTHRHVPRPSGLRRRRRRRQRDGGRARPRAPAPGGAPSSPPRRARARASSHSAVPPKRARICRPAHGPTHEGEAHHHLREAHVLAAARLGRDVGQVVGHPGEDQHLAEGPDDDGRRRPARCCVAQARAPNPMPQRARRARASAGAASAPSRC